MGEKKSEIILYERIIDRYEDTILKNKEKAAKFISIFLSGAIDTLSTKGPSKRLFFSDAKGEEFLKVMDMDPKVIKDAAKESTAIDDKWQRLNNPFVLGAVACIYVYIKHKTTLNRGKVDLARLVNLLLTLKFYSIAQRNSYKFAPDPEIMDYTIDNLNKRFSIRKVNTIFEAVQGIADSHIAGDFSDTVMKRETDEQYKYYITNLDTRIRSFMNNITGEFMKNHKAGKTTIVETQMREDSEGKQYIANVDNISGNITTVVRKLHIRLVSSTTPDIKLLQKSIDKVNGPAVTEDGKKRKKELTLSKMTVVMTSIMESDEPLLYDLIQEIVTFFLMEKKGRKVTDLKSGEYIQTMLKIYSVSNTRNDSVLKMKSILDGIVKIHAEEFLKTTRVVTVTSYLRNCIYTYIVLYIARYSQ